MAMNKVEKATLEALETELAFRWPTEAEPERMSLEDSIANDGWDFNSHSKAINKMWTTTVTHGAYYEGRRGTGSQRGKTLYRTFDDAALAMRWEMCRRFAVELRRADLQRAAHKAGEP